MANTWVLSCEVQRANVKLRSSPEFSGLVRMFSAERVSKADIFLFADKDDDSNLTLEKLHDLAVDMARKKRHHLLDRHYSAIETVASVQDNWNGFNEPPISPMSSGSTSNKNSVTFADLDDESNRENTVNHTRTKFRSLGQYRSSGKVSRRASEKELDELKRNRDDLEIDIENKEHGRGRFATFGGPLPGGDRALMVILSHQNPRSYFIAFFVIFTFCCF